MGSRGCQGPAWHIPAGPLAGGTGKRWAGVRAAQKEQCAACSPSVHPSEQRAPPPLSPPLVGKSSEPEKHCTSRCGVGEGGLRCKGGPFEKPAHPMFLWEKPSRWPWRAGPRTNLPAGCSSRPPPSEDAPRMGPEVSPGRGSGGKAGREGGTGGLPPLSPFLFRPRLSLCCP